IDRCDEQNACSAAKHSNGSQPALADESAHQRSALGHLQCARVPPERNTLAALTRVLTKVLGQAWRTAGLEMLDQLRLSLELIRTGQQMLPGILQRSDHVTALREPVGDHPAVGCAAEAVVAQVVGEDVVPGVVQDLVVG